MAEVAPHSASLKGKQRGKDAPSTVSARLELEDKAPKRDGIEHDSPTSSQGDVQFNEVTDPPSDAENSVAFDEVADNATPATIAKQHGGADAAEPAADADEILPATPPNPSTSVSRNPPINATGAESRVEHGIVEEETAIQRGQPEVAAASAPAEEAPEMRMTEHAHIFMGNKWESLLMSSRAAIEQAIRQDAAAALGLPTSSIEMQRVEASESGLTCEMRIHHPATLTASAIEAAMHNCPYEATMQLRKSKRSPHAQQAGGAGATSASKKKMPKHPTSEKEKTKTPQKASHTPLARGAKPPPSTKSHIIQYSGARVGKESLSQPIPTVLVAPRFHHPRAPRLGAEYRTDAMTAMYVEEPIERAPVPHRRHSTAKASPQGTPSTSYRAATTSPQRAAPTNSPDHATKTTTAATSTNPTHAPPQHMEQGVASMALRNRHNIVVSPATLQPRAVQQQEQAPPIVASNRHSLDRVEHSGSTHAASHRSPSPLQSVPIREEAPAAKEAISAESTPEGGSEDMPRERPMELEEEPPREERGAADAAEGDEEEKAEDEIHELMDSAEPLLSTHAPDPLTHAQAAQQPEMHCEKEEEGGEEEPTSEIAPQPSA